MKEKISSLFTQDYCQRTVSRNLPRSELCWSWCDLYRGIPVDGTAIHIVNTSSTHVRPYQVIHYLYGHRKPYDESILQYIPACLKDTSE